MSEEKTMCACGKKEISIQKPGVDFPVEVMKISLEDGVYSAHAGFPLVCIAQSRDFEACLLSFISRYYDSAEPNVCSEFNEVETYRSDDPENRDFTCHGIGYCGQSESWVLKESEYTGDSELAHFGDAPVIEPGQIDHSREPKLEAYDVHKWTLEKN